MAKLMDTNKTDVLLMLANRKGLAAIWTCKVTLVPLSTNAAISSPFSFEMYTEIRLETVCMCVYQMTTKLTISRLFCLHKLVQISMRNDSKCKKRKQNIISYRKQSFKNKLVNIDILRYLCINSPYIKTKKCHLIKWLIDQEKTRKQFTVNIKKILASSKNVLFATKIGL